MSKNKNSIKIPKSKPRNPNALNALKRKTGMNIKHKLQPKDGARNLQEEFLKDIFVLEEDIDKVKTVEVELDDNDESEHDF